MMMDLKTCFGDTLIEMSKVLRKIDISYIQSVSTIVDNNKAIFKSEYINVNPYIFLYENVLLSLIIQKNLICEININEVIWFQSCVSPLDNLLFPYEKNSRFM